MPPISSHAGLSALGLIRVAQHMSLALGPMLTVTLVTLAIVGNTTACWLGSLAVLQASGVVLRFLGASGVMLVGFAAELFKLGLATEMRQHGHRCPIVVLLLWATCVAYAWLMPVILLAYAPIWPTGGVFVSCAIAWAFLQLVSGLAPMVNWSTPRVDPQSSHVLPTKQPSDDPGVSPHPGAGAASEHLSRLDVDAVFARLSDLVFRPDAALETRIRIGRDYDISASQRDLARHMGLSRSTLRRGLHRLEGQGRLTLGYTYEGTTHIKLHRTRV